jgi:GT2 family glycosyltransferase
MRESVNYWQNPWVMDRWAVNADAFADPSLPLITIGVLTCNRRDDLLQTLDVLLHATQYPLYEVLLIDNGSTDGSLEIVRNRFPSVRIHEVGVNRGVSSRNLQTAMARGKYLFSYDDDSMPATPTTILRMVQHMESHPDIDVISTTCYRPLSGLSETKDWGKFGRYSHDKKGFEGLYIVEGGACFRLETLRSVAGYDPRMFLGAEGFDLSVQLYKQGRSMYFCPWFGTLHFASPLMRPKGIRVSANSRNSIWVLAKHWPWLALIPLLPLFVARRLLAMAMHRATSKENWNGIREGFRGIRPFFQEKPKLSWKQVYHLKRWYISLLRWA